MAYSIEKKDMINYPAKDLDNFHIYIYEWIDNLNFTLKPEDCLEDYSEYEDIASKRFLEAGWDGDGSIELMWIPPFVFHNSMTSQTATLGVTIWHVKQQEDGISWILSPIELPFVQN